MSKLGSVCEGGVVLLVQPEPLLSSGVRWLLVGLDWSRLGWLALLHVSHPATAALDVVMVMVGGGKKAEV